MVYKFVSILTVILLYIYKHLSYAFNAANIYIFFYLLKFMLSRTVENTGIAFTAKLASVSVRSKLTKILSARILLTTKRSTD